MRQLFPILQPGAPKIRSNIYKRFDSLYTALVLFAQLAKWSFSSTLIALLQQFFNRIISLSFGSPTTLINNLKINVLYYIAYVRGGATYANALAVQLGWEGLHGDHLGHSREEISVVLRILKYRDELVSGGISSADLVYFDRIVLAIMNFHRVILLASEPNFSTITDPTPFVYPKDTGFFPDLAGLLLRLGITKSEFWALYRAKAKGQGHIIMSTAGPNGPASWTAHSDAKALLGNSDLFTSFRYLAEVSGMPWLVTDMFGTVSLPGYDAKTDHLIHSGKLYSFDEWGGKNRVVAIVDYWTQVLLTPLQETIFHYLRQLEQDGTFNQDSACERVRAMTLLNGVHVNSFDLTAATDRLPITIQEEILAYLTNPGFAKAWVTLLTAREYYHENTNATYRYRTGQPMGSISSWAMLALTHHVIVQMAAVQHNSSPYVEYALLGDDIVLTGQEVSLNYRNIIASLHVSINEAKSILHHSDVAVAAEFCKRVYIMGVEYSSFPVKLIAKTIMNGRLAPQLQNELFRRGITENSTWLLSWLTGIVDRESAQFLAILNSLPASLSSLLCPINPGGTLGDFKIWYGDRYAITRRDLVSAFMFTAITEQLKRLDNLLRQAQMIHSAIQENAFGYATNKPSFIGWQYSNPEHDITKLAASIPRLTPTHPIVKAAQAEMDRIAMLLADLRSGNAKVVSAAQSRILDMFRSSLVDAWNDPEAARGQADRSLIQRALTNLTDIVVDRTPTESNPRGHYLDYTVNLAYLNRLWSVSWQLGEDIRINSVRSRVPSNATEANLKLADITSTVSIIDQFRRERKSFSGQFKSKTSSSPISKSAVVSSQNSPPDGKVKK